MAVTKVDIEAERKDLEAWGYVVESIKPAFKRGFVAVTSKDGLRHRWIVRGPEFASRYPIYDDAQ